LAKKVDGRFKKLIERQSCGAIFGGRNNLEEYAGYALSRECEL
jgi:hypothetical protein